MSEPSETVPERTAAATQQRPVNQILAWTGIAAAAVFIVAVVFFSGFYIGRSTDRDYHHDRWNEMPGPGMMGPGMMGPGMGPQPGQMGPPGQWDPGQPPTPTATPRNAPRP
ncbi:hypothetical protein ABGB19_11220 [Mycobacterium sp. B14F4]|uniref:hypothetical protein n=1 Tax=Mycobacterium sp. B14F4 TaxID=3153565 RepID=UPI00325EA066